MQERRELDGEEKTPKFTIDRTEELNSLIARFICSEVLSFDVVERDTFRL